MNPLDVSIIGCGRLGGALALALAKTGHRVCELASRDRQKAQKIAAFISPKPSVIGENEFKEITADVVFITTSDDQIENVARQLAASLENSPFVFHTSGSRSSDILSPLREKGCQVGSFHPLASFSDSETGANNFKGAFICLEGDADALAFAEKIAFALGAQHFSIEPKYKALYHASAVTSCGHLVALIATAIEMLAKCGLERKQAQEILLPLVESTVKNLSNSTPAKSLTGTFARADVQTLRLHLDSLRENVSVETQEIYTLLGKKSLELARENGVGDDAISEMEQVLGRKER